MYGGGRPQAVPVLVQKLWDTFGLRSGAHVADICCGYGHASLEFATRGAAVTALDISPEFVQRLQQLGDALDLPILAMCGDASLTPFGNAHCVSLILWNSLGVGGPGADAAILENARLSVHPRGALAVELTTVEQFPALRRDTVRRTSDGRVFRRRREIDPSSGVLQALWTVAAPDGSILKHAEFRRQLYRCSEVARLLESAGWRDVRWETCQWGSSSPTTLFVAGCALDRSRQEYPYCHW